VRISVLENIVICVLRLCRVDTAPRKYDFILERLSVLSACSSESAGCVDDDCFYYHSWRNNVVIAFGTLSSFLT